MTDPKTPASNLESGPNHSPRDPAEEAAEKWLEQDHRPAVSNNCGYERRAAEYAFLAGVEWQRSQDGSAEKWKARTVYLLRRSKQLKYQLRDAEAKLTKAMEALRKIDEPKKYHHWEEDPYTRAGCFQFVAHEALREIEG